MLTKEEVKFLESFLERQDVLGKPGIRKFIWLNTVQPKFKVGDYIVFSEKHAFCYGNPVRNMIGKVKEVLYCYDGRKSSEKKICYGIDYSVECNGKIEDDLYACTDEYNCTAFKGKDTVNHISKNGENQQEHEIYF